MGFITPKLPSKVKTVLTDSTLHIIVCAAIGLGLGIGLSAAEVSDEVVSWIALPGDLFLRSLKCVVILMVFTSMCLSVVEMVSAGKAFAIGWKTICMYMMTTVLASFEGLVTVLIFKRWFTTDQEDTPPPPLPLIQIHCDAENTTTLIQDPVSGAVNCLANTNITSAMLEYTSFLFNDVNDYFAKSVKTGLKSDISLSQTMQDGIFRKMFSSNIIKDFSTGNFLAVIVFGIIFGCAMVKMMNDEHKKKNKKNESVDIAVQSIYNVINQSNSIFVIIICWIIAFTPIAVISLIAGALAGQTDLVAVFKDIGLLVGAGLIAFGFHMCIVYPLLFLAFTRSNPLTYMRFMLPAQFFAFASGSSAATLPLNIECAVKSKRVPRTIANFVLSLGATINMDGGAIYFPIVIVFLGVSAGLPMDAATYFLIILLSTLGSAGTAPVPSASLVLIITAYNTVFGTTGIPDRFGYILVIDWFMDRCRTLVNITGDNFITGIVSSLEGGGFDLEGEDNDDTDDENDVTKVGNGELNDQLTVVVDEKKSEN